MKTIVVLVSTLFFVACSTPKPNSVQPAGNVSKASETSAPAKAPAAALAPAPAPATPQKSEADKLAAELQKLHHESVYFDYNEYSLKPGYRDVIEQHAANYKKHKNTTLTLEGNADERGSSAYNMALGEKRATAVKKVLVTLGVPASKIKVVSYGNTKPKLVCHEEMCWKENRRVDFIFTQK